MDKLAVLSVRSFYGDSPTGSTRRNFLKKRIDTERKDNNSKSLLSDLQRYVKIFSERTVWKWYSRQQDAFDFSLTVKGLHLQVFAFEKVDCKRRFLVTTLKQFWNRYKFMEESERHYYEVIPINSPSRLYFDIEFTRKDNPGLDGLIVLETFIDYVSYCLLKQFEINTTRNDVVDLDSSTENKFSRHLIFHLKENMVFENNVACGKFVKDICHSLKSYLETGKSNEFFPLQMLAENFDIKNLNKKLPSLIVKSGQSDTFLCDLAVYSKNRNFRLYNSSKVTKMVPLVISNENKFVFKTKLTKNESRTYRNKGEVFDPDFLLFCDTLVCNNKSDYKTLLYGSDYNIPHSSIMKVKHAEDSYQDGTEVSPFPELDAFVLRYCRENCKEGVIKKWLLFKSTNVIIYDIGKNNWCRNINREHKSNKVYYVADLRTKQLYQKCHDPDCYYFRSSGVFIPDCINPMIEDEVDLSDEMELNELFSSEFELDFFAEEKTKLIGDRTLTNIYSNKSVPAYQKDFEFDLCDEDFNSLFDDDFFVSDTVGSQV